MKPFSLQPVIDLMQTRTDEATRHLAQLIAAEQNARNKFEMLQQYRDEYALRFQQAIRQGIDRREWQNYQDFLQRLDEAITQQSQNVKQQEQHTLTGQQHWQQQRTKLKALDTLSERHRAKQITLELRYEQKMQDEFATHRHYHGAIGQE
jgi:flagellar FliJ protein